MNLAVRYLPWGVTALAALYLAATAAPPRARQGQADVYDFARLPVVDHGRVKPIDTLARTSLMILSGRQTYTDSKGDSQPAIRWLLDLMTNGERDMEAARRDFEKKVFRIQDDGLRQALGLPERADALFSLSEMAPHLRALFELAQQLETVEPERRNSRVQAVLDLASQVRLFHTLAGRQDKVFRIDNDQVLALLDLEPRSGFRYAPSEFVLKLGPLLQENRRARAVKDRQRELFDQKVLDLGQHIALYVQLTQPESLYAVPPANPGEEWKELGQAGEKNATTRAWVAMLTAYGKDDPAEFNRDLADYASTLRDTASADQKRARFEVLFNHFAPFYQCAVLYVFVVVLACLGWVEHLGFLQRGAFWLAAFTFAVHLTALVARMYLSGRWLVFVTNLYSSAVFIGLIGAALGLILEGIFKNGLGNAVAGVTGAASLLVAHHLGSDGDTLEMLQAVLDTNFWLATHVTCITIGYASTIVAGFLGIGYIFAGVLTRGLHAEARRTLSQMIYGIVCFATLFSFTGTVLGGIWADQSWGRFWGWDPKENGALLIVLWNALILHARWGGMAKQRGIAVLAVVGNMVTGWSWFGTNQLGVGLHAYGFSNTLAFGLTCWWVFNVVFLVLGLLPLRLWRSFAAQAPAPPTPTPPPQEPLVRDQRGKSTAVTTAG
jgi:ABC-type transport system involved in cytochrome c biogenesis permease subunit